MIRLLWAFAVTFFLGLPHVSKSQQWERLPGPTPGYNDEVGSVTCIATNDTFVWIGTQNSGVFRTPAQPFAQWQAQNTGIQSFTIYSLNYTPGLLVATTKQGVYKSTDLGNNWVAINTGLPIGKQITAFAAANNVLLAATTDYGVFASTNNGLSWQKANNGLLDNNVLDLETDGSNFWALTLNAGLYKSINGAQSWQHIDVDGGCTQCFELELVDSTLFLAGGSILVSHNNGKNWTTDTTLKNITGIAAYNGRLAAHSLYRVYESTDTGKTWQLDEEFNLDSTDRINTALATPLEVKYVATQTHGIYRGAIASVTWKPYNDELVTSNITALSFTQNTLFTTAYGHLYSSVTQGRSWADISPADTRVHHYITLYQPNLKLLAATDSGVYVTDYNNINWKRIDNFIGTQKVYKLFDVGTSLYAAANDGLYYSPSKNLIQFLKQGNPIDTLLFTEVIEAHNLLYAGTNGGLYSSANGGQTFARVDSVDIPKRYVYFLKEVNGKVWMKLGVDTYITTDGTSWPRYYYMGWLTFASSLSVVQSQWFVASNSGYIFSDTANPDSWNYLKTVGGLDANVFCKSDSFLFMGTGAGIWRLPLTSVITNAPTINSSNPLSVYPNPATNLIEWNAELPLEKVAVYSINGQLQQECTQCNYFDIEGLPQGIYLLKATTAKGVLLQRFIKQ